MASEAHHHTGLGGMLDHGLEVTLQSLLVRRGKLLQVGVEPEPIGKVHDRAYRYVVLQIIKNCAASRIDMWLRSE